MGGVPPLPSHHMHRDQLEQDVQYCLLTAGPRSYTCICITGMPGVGKTCVAIAALQGLKAQHFDCVIWLTAKGLSNNIELEIFQEIYQRMLEYSLRVHGVLRKYSLAQGVDSYIEAIKLMMSGQKCLLVVDRLQKRENLRNIQKLPCILMVISQLKNPIDDNRITTKTVFVDLLNTEGSKGLISQFSGVENNYESIRRLRAACDGHPLALTNFGAAICVANSDEGVGNRHAFEDLMRCVSEDAGRLYLRMPHNHYLFPDGHFRHRTLMQCFDFALGTFSNQDKTYYIMIAALPSGYNIPVEMMEQVWNLSTEQTIEKLSVFEQHSLLKVNYGPGCGGEGRPEWSIHPLLRGYVNVVAETQPQYYPIVAAARRMLKS